MRHDEDNTWGEMLYGKFRFYSESSMLEQWSFHLYYDKEYTKPVRTKEMPGLFNKNITIDFTVGYEGETAMQGFIKPTFMQYGFCGDGFETYTMSHTICSPEMTIPLYFFPPQHVLEEEDREAQINGTDTSVPPTGE